MEGVKNLILSYTDEYRWIGDDFIIWVPWYKVHAFMIQLRELIIIDTDEDMDMDAQIQNDNLCIVLNRNLIDTWLLEKLFLKWERSKSKMEEFAVLPAEYGRYISRRYELLERIPSQKTIIYTDDSLWNLIQTIYDRLHRMPVGTRYSINCYGQVIFDKTKEEIE